MARTLKDLLNECVVQLSLEGQSRHGTGFFAAPGLILTCAHVVADLKTGKPYGDSVSVRYRDDPQFSRATIWQLLTDIDAALLAFPRDKAEGRPCVMLEDQSEQIEQLYCFGYPNQDFDNGAPYTFDYEGLTGDHPPFMKFKQGQVLPGCSGAPLLNLASGKVGGMLKFRSKHGGALVGGGIPAGVILDRIGELKALQEVFHAKDRRWADLVKQMQNASKSTSKTDIHVENSQIGVIGDHATVKGGVHFG